jgi:uncharacterized membrane protein YphA (DoxX/SURF4 family)
MKIVFTKTALLSVIQVVIGCIFIWAGGEKFRNPQAFADSISTFRLLPNVLINPLALGLPPFEIVIGALLILNCWKRLTAFCALILMIIFIIALAQGLIRGLPLNCGCFGSAGTSSAVKIWVALARDFLILAGVTILYRQALYDTKPTVPLGGSAN